MPKSITLSGSTYNLPQQNDNAPWGEDLSDLIEAIATVVESLSGTGDILTRNFTVANNQSSAANITGLTFDVAVVRSAVVTYSIYRSTDTPAELGECGFLLLTYMTDADAWTMTRYANDDAGLVFTITDGGQVQYTSSNMAGASYAGLMKFNARAFLQS